MATYNYNGQRFNLPDGLTPDQAMQTIQQYQSQSVNSPSQVPASPGTAPAGGKADAGATQGGATAPPTATFNPKPAVGSIDPDTLQYNSDWTNAARIRWQALNPGKAIPSNKDLAEFGLDEMGWFNYNSIKMGVDAARIASASPDEKKAFLYLLDTYDKLDMSWGGFGRFIKGAATDPLNYVGLSTLGIGLVGKEGLQLATKEGLKQMLRAGIVTGIEGAIIGGAQERVRQQAEINAGGRKEADWGEVGKTAAITGAGGVVLGGAAEGIGMLVRGARKGVREAPELLPGRGVPEAPKEAAGGAPVQVGNAIPTEEVPRPVAVGERAVQQAEPNVAPTVETPNVVEPRPTTEATLPEGMPRPANENAVGVARPADLPPVEAPKLPVLKDDNPIIEAVRMIKDFGFRDLLRGGERAEAAGPIVDKLLNMDPGHMTRLVEEVRHAAFNGNEGNVLSEAIRQATETAMADFTKVAQEAKAGNKKAAQALDQATNLMEILRRFDKDVSSGQGTGLGARAGGVNTGAMREITIDKILEQNQWPRTPENLQRAQYQMADILAKRLEAIEKDAAIVKLDDQITEALAKGDSDLASSLRMEKQTRIEEKLIDEKGSQTFGTKIGNLGNGIVRGLNEWFISNVFTPGTAVVNVLPALAKMIYRPITDALLRNPLDHISWRIAAAQYAAYTTNFNTALKASLLAFKYERGMLSGDFALYAGRDPFFSKQYGGGIIRFIPRVLGASDELFSQLSYRAYVQSEALGKALIEARSMGLSKGAARQYATDEVGKAIANSFEKNAGSQAVDMLYREGVSRGYSGPKLQEWVKSQLDKNQEFFRTATNTTGLGYAEDMLFKREFSGEGTVSSIAKHYEQLVNKHPTLRLMGQLFFRTPVRVFEEGFRLTPGLNIVSGAVAGQFLNDLRGLNGMNSQLRAQGEAMLSLAIGAMVVQHYAAGKLTGGGPDNWKERRSTEDGKNWKPYTWKIGDYELNYRNLDPLATPIKIMTNVMDRLYALEYRKAQGEYDNKSEWQNAASLLGVASLSIVQAIKDANLAEGLDQIIRFGQDITDPEHKEMALVKFLGQKAQLFIPNTLQKTMALDNPQLNDPARIEDFIRQRFNPGDPLIPKRYTALGDVVTSENPLGSLVGVDIYQPDKTYSKRDLVNQELAKIAFNGERPFIAPYTVSYIGEFKGRDLRTMRTKEGISFYDAWQQEVSKTKMADTLYNVIVKGQNLPMGTKSHVGAKEEAATDIINRFREQAFYAVLKKEFPGFEPLIRSKMEEAKAKSGKKDTSFAGPYAK